MDMLGKIGLLASMGWLGFLQMSSGPDDGVLSSCSMVLFGGHGFVWSL
jgi:hypothetical protein